MSDYRKALDYYYQALRLWQSLANGREQGVTLNYISQTYSNLGDHQKALENETLSLSLLRAVGDRSEEAATLNISARLSR